MTERPLRRSFLALLLGCVLAAMAVTLAAAAAAPLPPPYENLVQVRSKRLDAVYLLPGADFRAYTKVMIDPVQVSFREGWVKSVNRGRGAARRISESDAQEIAAAMRSGFDDIFADAFKAKGYEVVSAPGPEVLRLSPEVVNIYINAPAPAATGVRATFTVEAGEATLMLQVRDAATGAVLGVAIDRNETRGSGGVELATSFSNRMAFVDLFRRWADICVRGLEALKAQPPVPAKNR